MASDVHPTASGAELQSHRRILALGLTERYVTDNNQDDFLVAEDKERQQLRKWDEPSVWQSRGIFSAREPGRIL